MAASTRSGHQMQDRSSDWQDNPIKRETSIFEISDSQNGGIPLEPPPSNMAAAAATINVLTSLVGVVEGKRIGLLERLSSTLVILSQVFMVGYLCWLGSQQEAWEAQSSIYLLMINGLVSIFFVRDFLRSPCFYDENAGDFQRPQALLSWVHNRLPGLSPLFAISAFFPTAAFTVLGSYMGYRDGEIWGLLALFVVELAVYFPMSVGVVLGLYVSNVHKQNLVELQKALDHRVDEIQQKQQNYQAWIQKLICSEEQIARDTQAITTFFILPTGFMMTIMLLDHAAYLVNSAVSTTDDFFNEGLFNIIVHILAAIFHFLWIIVLLLPAVQTNSATANFIEACIKTLVESELPGNGADESDAPRKLLLVHRIGQEKLWWKLFGIKVEGQLVAKLAYFLFAISTLTIRVIVSDESL
jgi:hypothetical protein